MANGNFGIELNTDFDLHTNKVQQQYKVLNLTQRNEQLERQTEGLQSQLHQSEENNLHLVEKCKSLEEKLRIQQNTVDNLKAELHQSLSQNAAKYLPNEFSKKEYTYQQEITKLKRCQKELERELYFAHTKNEDLSNALKEKTKKNTKVMDLKHKVIQVMIENKSLDDKNKALLDEIRQLKTELTNNAKTHTDDNLVSTTSGRFKIKKICIECSQCHQAFDSLAEMEASTCVFHPANSSPTGTPGRYYWKCCKTEAVGKSSPGCKKGKHIPGRNFNGSIT